MALETSSTTEFDWEEPLLGRDDQRRHCPEQPPSSGNNSRGICQRHPFYATLHVLDFLIGLFLISLSISWECFEVFAPMDDDGITGVCQVVPVLGFGLTLRGILGLTAGRFGAWWSATYCTVLVLNYDVFSWLSIVELVRLLSTLYWISKQDQMERDEDRGQRCLRCTTRKQSFM